MIPSIADTTMGKDRGYFLHNPHRKVFVRPFVYGEADPPDDGPDDLTKVVVIVYRFGGSKMLKAPVWVRALPPDDESIAWDMLWDWAVQHRLPGFQGTRP